MKPIAVSALVAAALIAGCKQEASAAPPDAPKAASAAPAPAAPKKPALVELDLSKWGPAFKGYVAMAPAGSSLEFDDPSRQLKISEDDYLNVNEAPFFEDALASVGKGDSTVKNLSKKANEATWERAAPIGTFWAFDTLVTTGKTKWSCNGETLTSAATREVLLEVCRSIRKK